MEDLHGYSKMSVNELKTEIVDLVKQNHSLEKDKKEMSDSFTDLIKNNKSRIAAALEELEVRKIIVKDDGDFMKAPPIVDDAPRNLDLTNNMS